MQGFIEKYNPTVWRFLDEPLACPFIVARRIMYLCNIILSIPGSRSESIMTDYKLEALPYSIKKEIEIKRSP